MFHHKSKINEQPDSAHSIACNIFSPFSTSIKREAATQFAAEIFPTRYIIKDENGNESFAHDVDVVMIKDLFSKDEKDSFDWKNFKMTVKSYSDLCKDDLFKQALIQLLNDEGVQSETQIPSKVGSKF